jgi:D-glycero-D-manno-heptose 1,7-bisphosphate phosphatase
MSTTPAPATFPLSPQMLFSKGATPFPHPVQARRAVFLDRDGTLNVEKGYIHKLEELELLPNVAYAVRRLNEAGILCLLTTNQTGAARGFYSIEHIHALNTRLLRLLWEEAGAWLDGVYYSPYYERGTVAEWTRESDCRKPGTGMLRQAVGDFPSIQLDESFIVGDKATDVHFAHNAGCKSVLVKTGYGQRVLEGKYQNLEQQPWLVADSLAEAIDPILAASR